MRTRASARVGLVGSSEWAAEVAAVAPAWRREVVATIDPSRIDGAEPTWAALDELVVSRRALEEVLTRLPFAERAGVATLVCHEGGPQTVFAPALNLQARLLKRVLDVVVGSVALVATAPVMGAAALAVWIDSGGPVLFRQLRPGLNGRSFRLLKLRTMHVDNDDGEHRSYVTALIGGTGQARDGIFKLVDDPRVTRVGRFLRRYSIDELPQLINVLRGEMSLVGPRPPVPAEVDQYDAEQWLRLRVKPGMTGAWQIAGRCERTYAEMVALDVDYWRHWSLGTELRILLRTLPCVLSARGAA